MSKKNLYDFMFESILLNLFGVFYFTEVLVYNFLVIVLSCVLNILTQNDFWPYYTLIFIQLLVYNTIDSYYNFSRELGEFRNLITIERRSLQL